MTATVDNAVADLRRANAELQRQLGEYRAERDEALAQQTATAEVLGVINSSPGDLAPVFDAILEKAHTLCGATQGALVTFDGEDLRAVATHELPEQFAEMLRGPRPIYPGSPADLLGQGKRLIHIKDQAVDEQINPIGRASVEIAGTRTLLMVPLRKDEAFLGYITAFRQEVRPFTDKQIALLQNFAAQAVIAMENARLITDTREALDQQTATAEVLGVINASPGNLAPVFDAMLEKAVQLCQASFGILWNFDGELASAGALYQVPQAYATLCREPFRPSPGSSPARMIRGEGTLGIVDVRDWPGYRDGDALTRAIADLAGARSIVIAPLRKDTGPVGAITLYRQEVRPFTDKQIALLESFAAQALIAMDNARLIAETREALEQQTATAEVLQVINSSPGDLEPVFDAILEKARSLCGAVHGALIVYDGEHFRAVATHGLPEPLKGLLCTPFRPNPVHQALLRGERLIHIADQAAVRTDTSIARASVDAGARTLLLVPLRKDGTLRGYITASRWEVRPFSDKEIALLENFAAQAVIAMENARLLGADSDDVGRAFRLMSATCSDRSRPAVPIDVGRGGGAPAGRT